jgi:hypothetical protein
VVVLPVVPLGEMVVRRGAVELASGWVSRAPSSAAGLAAGRPGELLPGSARGRGHGESDTNHDGNLDARA